MDKTEQFTRKYFRVPNNWDKFDFKQIRYSLLDLEDAAEQFAESQLAEYKGKLLEVLEVTGKITKEDIEICFLTTTTNDDE